MANFNKLCIDNMAIIHEKNGHKVMIKQYSVSLKEELPIYRYVHLSYLIDAINNRRLFVPSIKQFSDLIEKNGCKKYDDLQLVRPVPAHKDKLRNKKIAHPNGKSSRIAVEHSPCPQRQSVRQ